jgi:hypothetical protein
MFGLNRDGDYKIAPGVNPIPYIASGFRRRHPAHDCLIKPVLPAYMSKMLALGVAPD